MTTESTSSTETPAATCPFGHGGVDGSQEAAAYYGYRPFDQKDPFPAYANLRAEAPIFYDDRTDLWVVSRYDDIKAVFDDWETFSSQNAQAPVRPRGPQATKVMEDGGFTAYSGLSARIPPEHTRIRAIAQKAFTPRRFKVMEPEIRANVVSRLEGMLTRESATGDMFRDLAYEIPTITILTLIGADLAKIDDYKRWSDSRAAMTWGNLSDEEQVPHAHNLVEYWQECQSLVALAKEQGGDNLTADVVKAQAEGAEISDHEIASLLYSLLFAGHETTTTLIANCFRLLPTDRDQWEALIEDPKKIPGAIEEVLRYAGSIVAWRRKATRDAVVAGQEIKEGEGLLLVVGSANRDLSHFEEPEEFDISRANAREHLSFGFGIHYCLGNKLAKLQAKICLEEATRLIPSLRVADNVDIPFRENLSFRVPETVPVTWTA